jgi:hypothetical protein
MRNHLFEEVLIEGRKRELECGNKIVKSKRKVGWALHKIYDDYGNLFKPEDLLLFKELIYFVRERMDFIPDYYASRDGGDF